VVYNQRIQSAFVEEKSMMESWEGYGGHLVNIYTSSAQSSCPQLMQSSEPIGQNWQTFRRENMCQNPWILQCSGPKVFTHQDRLRNFRTPFRITDWSECGEGIYFQEPLPVLARPNIMLPDQRRLGYEQQTIWSYPEKYFRQTTLHQTPQGLSLRSYVPRSPAINPPQDVTMKTDFQFNDSKPSLLIPSQYVPMTNDLFIEELVQEFSNDFAHENLSIDQRIDDCKFCERNLMPVRQVKIDLARIKPVQQLYTDSVFSKWHEQQLDKPIKEEFWVPENPEVCSITRLPQDVMTHALLYLSETTLWRIYKTCKLFRSAYFRQEGHGKIEFNRILFFAAQGHRFLKLQKLKVEKLRTGLVNEFFFPTLREVELINCFMSYFCLHTKVEKLRVKEQFHTRMLSFYPNIKKLRITGIANIELGSIVHFLPKTLQRLTLDVATVKPCDWKVLGQLADLELLSLWIGQNNDFKRHELVNVEIPSILVKLRVILIRGLEMTPVIPSLPALEILTLEKIHDLDIKELPSIPTLKTLDLYRCEIDFWDIHLLESKYPILQVLSLCFDDEDIILNLDLFPNLDCLRDLILSDVKLRLGESRNEFCHSKTPRLAKLTLDHVILDTPHLFHSLKHTGSMVKVTFKSCTFLKPFKLPESVGVKELVFWRCEPLWLGVLASSHEVNRQLESMTITRCRFKETDLWNLNKFPNLVKLDLSENALSTENIPRLLHLKRLTMVSCNLNEWDVGRLLTSFPALVALDLSKNKKLGKRTAKKHNSASINALNSSFFTWDQGLC
jgi:hypothetical protein